MLPPACGAPVGLMTRPWILPVAAAGGACASTGTAANASRPSQSDMVLFMFSPWSGANRAGTRARHITSVVDHRDAQGDSPMIGALQVGKTAPHLLALGKSREIPLG